MPRFFALKENIDESAGIITLIGDDAHHIARSLRMAEGEKVTVCDGEGTEYLCRLERIRDTESVCAVLSSEKSLAEPPYSLLVCQALVKGDRMDTAVQKSVESGATEIIPFVSSRCIVRMKDGKKDDDNKLRRLRRIASEAAKQCGRGRLPVVDDETDFDSMLRRAAKTDLPLFCYEDEKTRMLGTVLSNVRNSGETPASAAVVIGAEGGFSPEEAEKAEKAGLIPVSLGRRILRTESAAAFVLACLSSEFELR